MKNTYVVAALVGVFLAGSTSLAVAQGAQESQLFQITEFFVKPGMRADFEAGRKRAIERWEEQGRIFGAQMSVNQQGVYRQVSIRGDWEGFERRLQERLATPGNNPGNAESVDHISRSIVRTRPELGYAVDNPRVSFNEVGFIRYVFIYLRLGTGDQAEEILKKQAALRRRHEIRDNVIVTSSVAGHDVPMILLRFHARDMEDYYTQQRENRRMLGDEAADLRRQMGALARRIETSNNVVRRDLSYQPAN